VTVTGIGVFFTHESDPNWFGYLQGRGVQPFSAPSEGWAEAHGLFADLLGITALIGGAWFVARVSFAVFWFVAVTLVVVLSALISGSVIRFNVVKLEGKTFEEAERGYLQVFSRDFEYLVTARFELGPVASAIWVLAHVMAVMVIVVGGWIALRRVARSLPPAAVGPSDR